MKKYNSQFEMMTQQPVPSLIVKLGIPTMISMFVTSIYNMADSYFVGQINTSASGATGVVLGLMAILQARSERHRERQQILFNGFLFRPFLGFCDPAPGKHFSYASNAAFGQHTHYPPLRQNVCDMHSLRGTRIGFKLRPEQHLKIRRQSFLCHDRPDIWRHPQHLP